MHKIDWNDTNVANLWNYYSEQLSEDTYFTKHSGESMLMFLKKHVDFKGKVILDYGSGPCFFFEHLASEKYDFSYNAVDFSESSIDKAKSKFENDSRFASATHIASLPIPLNDDSADISVCIEVVEHLKDEYLDGALKELYRTLKYGGVMIVTTPNDEDLKQEEQFCPDCGAVFHKWQHVRSWNKASIKVKMEAMGFKTVAVVETKFGMRRTSMKSKLRDLMSNFLNFFNIFNKPKPHLVYIGSK